MLTWREFLRWLRRNGREIPGTKHYLFIVKCPDGVERRVACSRGTGSIDKKTWSKILKYELHMTQQEFDARW